MQAPHFWSFGFLLISCTGGNRDETAVLHTDKTSLDTCIVVTNRYANGSIESTGKVCNGEKHGYWRAFYADGSLKWEGQYSGGYTALPNLDSLPKNCKFVFDKNSEFTLYKGFQFRVIAPPLGPRDMIIHINTGRFAEPLDPDNFDYMVVPDTPGDLCIELDYRHRTGYPICKKCISIPG